MCIGFLFFSNNSYPLFYNPIFLGLVSIGLIFVLAGVILYKNPPKNMNWFYGYRTKTSMKNQELWDFAQTYSAKIMIKLGLVLVMISFLGLVYKPKIEIALMLSLILIILKVILLVYLVEIKLKQKSLQ